MTTLFHSAPDLLDEFKQFLPDTSAEGQAAVAASQAAAPPLAQGRGQAAALGGANNNNAAAGGKRSAPTSSATASAAPQAPASKRAKTASGKDTPPSGVASAGQGGKGKGKRKTNDGGRAPTKGASPADPHAMYHSDSPSVVGDPHQQAAAAAAAYYYGGAPPPSVSAHQQQQQMAAAQYGMPGGPAPVYAYEPPAPAPAPEPLLPPKPVPSQPDLAFFNRVKVHCKDQETYHEFLKLVNLYTQQLIDLTALVARAWLFLHQDEALWTEFKDIVGWVHAEPYVDGVLGDPGHRVELDALGHRVVENVPREDGPRWRKSHGDAGKWWETYGPSYRRLPPSEISLNCSGRDALCWEVLNDEWGEWARPSRLSGRCFFECSDSDLTDSRIFLRPTQSRNRLGNRTRALSTSTRTRTRLRCTGPRRNGTNTTTTSRRTCARSRCSNRSRPGSPSWKRTSALRSASNRGSGTRARASTSA